VESRNREKTTDTVLACPLLTRRYRLRNARGIAAASKPRRVASGQAYGVEEDESRDGPEKLVSMATGGLRDRGHAL